MSFLVLNIFDQRDFSISSKKLAVRDGRTDEQTRTDQVSYIGAMLLKFPMSFNTHFSNISSKPFKYTVGLFQAVYLCSNS